MRSIANPAGHESTRHATTAVLPGLVLAAAVVAQTPAETADSSRPDRWADAMAAFAQQDAEQPFPPGGVVFVGSSSIRLWDLPRSFPQLDPPPLNRGFGGSEIRDAIRHFDLLVAKHRPRLVVFYAGDNDIANGKSAEAVVADFQEFAMLFKRRAPDASLAYLAIKPSLKRWSLAAEMKRANDAIAALCGEDERLAFVDIGTPMLGADGRPRPELFVADGLHLNAAGYAVWAERLTLRIAGSDRATD